jgi:hypothetical protein
MGGLLDLAAIVAIVSIFFIFAGGTMMVDDLWGKAIVQPMQAKGPFSFFVFELVLDLFAASMIVMTISTFFRSLFGDFSFNIGAKAGVPGSSGPFMSIISAAMIVIVAGMLYAFIDFVIWHMPFLVLTCVVVFMMVGWARGIISAAFRNTY